MSRGFTLVELLVTIAIIALLAALSFYASNGVRQSAGTTKAIAALKSVVQANAIYSQENEGRINTLRWAQDPTEGGAGGWVANTFWGRVQPYLFPGIQEKNQAKLKAKILPELKRLFGSSDLWTMKGTAFEGARVPGDVSGLPVPLSFNREFYEGKKWKKTLQFPRPVTTAYISYGFHFFDKEDGQTYVPNAKPGENVANNIYFLPSRKAILGFLDGSVGLFDPPMEEKMFLSEN